MLCVTLFKSVGAVRFSGKDAFLESMSFHSEILGETNFGLVLDNFLVNAMILRNEIYCKTFQDKFLWNVKDSHYHNLGSDEKCALQLYSKRQKW